MTAPANHLQDARSAKRRRLAAHLYRCGRRPVLEALIAVDRGQPLDEVLTDFARIPAEVYKAVGADILDTGSSLFVIDGRRP